MNVNAVDLGCESSHRLTVLAVGLPDHARLELERLFQHTRWELRTVPTVAFALVQLPVPVVLSEPYLPDGSWRELLKQTGNWHNPPRLVVTSAAADDTLWAEVLNLGGYDVLARPFVPDEVFRVLALASHSWLDQQDRERLAAAGAH
jgi:DNA-binding NtrC family response regulator